MKNTPAHTRENGEGDVSYSQPSRCTLKSHFPQNQNYKYPPITLLPEYQADQLYPLFRGPQTPTSPDLCLQGCPWQGLQLPLVLSRGARWVANLQERLGSWPLAVPAELPAC